MSDTSNTESKSLPIACREARLLLPGMGTRAAARDGFSTEEVSAYHHYLGCSKCTEQGISFLARVPMDCRHAAEIAVNAMDKTGLFFSTQTILETVAQEHIYGRGFKRTSSDFGSIWKPQTACTRPLSKKIAQYWQGVPFSSAYDGDIEVIEFLPCLISWFSEFQLPLDVLFEIQKKTIKDSLKILASVHAGPGQKEIIMRHLEILQQKETIMRHLKILQQIVLLKK